MKPIKVFDVIVRRRILLLGIILVLILGTGIGFGASMLQKARKAKATAFIANESQLVLPENTVTYIGAVGYVSQRFFSKTAEPYNLNHFISATTQAADLDNRIWQVPQKCDVGKLPDTSVWGTYSDCYNVVSDGAGIILKYNQSIDIYGTVVIGDRVVFDAPSITLHDGAKIYANGQDNQLGWGDDCGAGGIGGQNGGVNNNYLSVFQSLDPSLNPTDALLCDPGKPGETPSILQVHNFLNTLTSSVNLSNSVKSYFIVNGSDIVGGNGQNGTKSVNQAHDGGVAGSASIGIGAGGGAGATGATDGQDSGNSGGAGGGFGIVLQASQLNIFTSAEVHAEGGNAQVAVPGKAARNSSTSTAGFGGAGGGGVVIIYSPVVNFFSSLGVEAPANYGLFNVSAGEFDPTRIMAAIAPNLPFGMTPKAGDGKLIIQAGNSLASVKKSVTNITAGSNNRPNYVFQAGDKIKITLSVTNLIVGQPVTIKDDVYSDNHNLATVDTGSISDKTYGSFSESQVIWKFPVDAITSSSKILTYTMTVN